MGERGISRGQEIGPAVCIASLRGFGVHAQPTVAPVGFCSFGGNARAVAVENVNSAPHADTVRAYSITVSSGICLDPKTVPQINSAALENNGLHALFF